MSQMEEVLLAKNVALRKVELLQTMLVNQERLALLNKKVMVLLEPEKAELFKNLREVLENFILRNEQLAQIHRMII